MSTKPTGPASTRSLVQQRAELDRMRLGVLVGLCALPLAAALSLSQFLNASSVVNWVLGGAWALIVVFAAVDGVLRYRRYKAAVANFESEHGRDAGKQDPVR